MKPGNVAMALMERIAAEFEMIMPAAPAYLRARRHARITEALQEDALAILQAIDNAVAKRQARELPEGETPRIPVITCPSPETEMTSPPAPSPGRRYTIARAVIITVAAAAAIHFGVFDLVDSMFGGRSDIRLAYSHTDAQGCEVFTARNGPAQGAAIPFCERVAR